MTVAARAWGRLTIPGKLVFLLVPVVLAVLVAVIALSPVLGPLIGALALDNLPFVQLVDTGVLLLT